MHTSIPVPAVLQQRGIALVVVLWMMVLLTVMAGSYSSTTRTESLSIAQHLHGSKARALAEAGIWMAVNDLIKPEAGRLWLPDGTSKSVFYDGNEINIQIQDEAGKIDLNTASQAILESFIGSMANDEITVRHVVDSILDWRDRDNLVRVNGAEDADYDSGGLDYDSKDGPFNTVEELRLVAGMTELLFQKIRSALTVHSHLPGINPLVADRKTLLALSGNSADLVDDYMLRRRVEPGISFKGLDSRVFSKSLSRTFSIVSVAVAGHSKIRLDVVVMMKRNAGLPFTVLSWREGLPAAASGGSGDS
jgi:general secretion pathway protein K